LITSALQSNGKISVSFVAVNNQTGITDLTLEVRNPSNTQVATGIPLTEYYSTGTYYGSVDVGVVSLGAHLTKVKSNLYPLNNASKVFIIAIEDTKVGGGLVQEATRSVGDTLTFKHIATTGLSDVQVTIYNAADSPILVAQSMVEIGSSGVYKFPFTPTSAGLYTGIMNSPTLGTKSVTEVIFKSPSQNNNSNSTSTVISNRIGTGTKEEC
jgi:hypothetical protein